MDATLVKNLHPLEVRVLLAFTSGEELSSKTLQQKLSYKEGHANQAFSWLLGKGLCKEVRKESYTFYEITETGIAFAQNGTPEERILELLKSRAAESGFAGLSLGQIAEALKLENKDVGSAFGALSKEGVLAMNEAKLAAYTNHPYPERILLTKTLLQKAAAGVAGADKALSGREPSAIAPIDSALIDSASNAIALIDEKTLSPKELEVISLIAKKRGAADSPFRRIEREVTIYTLTREAEEVAAELKKQGISGDETGALTQKMLEDGSWKNKPFRSYNTALPPARIIPGRINPYVAFLEGVKDKLCSLGFEEFDGPLVETEFWNSDALFMPQFHAARDIHDVYYVKNPTHATKIDEPFLSNIANAHETGGDTGSRGWNYSFDKDFTRRLILRSQGTVLSAHQLAKAKIPGKYFGIARCFRYDKVDATHLSDFYQTEGIVLGKDVNLRTLLGFLEIFAREIAGADEVKYVPGYFPFTEPSIEVHIKHPVLGWFELGGSGIFRPEVTKSMGIDVPVIAWGIGIDRMALMALGLNDLRELFSANIEDVRLRRGK
ncbi:MAG: phenylalanine--tRNA ligase subunit alpha [Treponemataceae bacterium]|nr:MAG: phenylalanine--tRNA ligase subunit alpha [Treponemataceae bacterium]